MAIIGYNVVGATVLTPASSWGKGMNRSHQYTATQENEYVTSAHFYGAQGNGAQTVDLALFEITAGDGSTGNHVLVKNIAWIAGTVVGQHDHTLPKPIKLTVGKTYAVGIAPGSIGAGKIYTNTLANAGYDLAGGVSGTFEGTSTYTTTSNNTAVTAWLESSVLSPADPLLTEAIPDQSVIAGAAINFNASDYFFDLDPLAYSISPIGAGVSINSTTGVITGSFPGPAGTHTFTVTASDGGPNPASDTFNFITAIDAPDAFVIPIVNNATLDTEYEGIADLTGMPEGARIEFSNCQISTNGGSTWATASPVYFVTGQTKVKVVNTSGSTDWSTTIKTATVNGVTSDFTIITARGYAPDFVIGYDVVGSNKLTPSNSWGKGFDRIGQHTAGAYEYIVSANFYGAAGFNGHSVNLALIEITSGDGSTGNHIVVQQIEYENSLSVGFQTYTPEEKIPLVEGKTYAIGFAPGSIPSGKFFNETITNGSYTLAGGVSTGWVEGETYTTTSDNSRITAWFDVETRLPTVAITSVTNVRPDETATLVSGNGYTNVSEITVNGYAATNLVFVDANTITFTVPRSCGVPLGSNVPVVVTDDNGPSDPFTVVFEPKTGWSYATTTKRVYWITGSETGDIITWDNSVTYNGQTYPVTISPSGVVDFGLNAPLGVSTQVYLQDAGLEYVATDTATITAGEMYTVNEYVFEVVAKDTYGQTDSQQITVFVEQEAVPVMPADTSVSANENQTAVGTFAASSGDHLVYSISGSDAGFFNLDATTGLVSFKIAPDYEDPLDSDNNNSYVFSITATNTRGTDSQVVTVNVVNLNDNLPVMPADVSVNIVEGVSEVGTFASTSGAGITYTISGLDATAFAINSTTGDLSFKTAPDFEAPQDSNVDNIYTVIVTATNVDGSDSQTVTVNVTNISDSAPVMGADTSVVLSEGATAVGTYVAADGNEVTYSLSGTDASAFNLDPTTGVLSFKNPANFEAPADSDLNNIYTIIITGTNFYGSDSQIITVTITDVADTYGFSYKLRNASVQNAPYFATGLAAVVTVYTNTGIYTINTTTGTEGLVSFSHPDWNGTDPVKFDVSISGLRSPVVTQTAALVS